MNSSMKIVSLGTDRVWSESWFVWLYLCIGFQAGRVLLNRIFYHGLCSGPRIRDTAF